MSHCARCDYPLFDPRDKAEAATAVMLAKGMGDPPEPVKAWTEDGEPLCEGCADGVVQP